MRRPNNFAFIDGVNLHLTYENLDWKLDYKRLRKFLESKYNVTVAYYFLGNVKDNSSIVTKLESYTYTTKLKEPSPYPTEEEYCPYCWKVIAPELNRYKADCDSFLTLTVMSFYDLFDKAVIITSDGDFDELVKLLIRKDKLRMVFAPCRAGCSKLLKKATGDKIAFLDDFKKDLEKN